MNRLLYVSLVLLACVTVARSQGEVAGVSSELTDADFATLRDRISVRESERSWEGLPWLTTYYDGLQAAAREGRPLLLWVMNGHPLGCT